MITANPPYIPTHEIAALPIEVRHEPLLALDGGADGNDSIKKIIRQAKNYLAPKGRLILEIHPPNCNAIIELLQKENFSSIQVYQDLAGHERVILAAL